MAGCSRGASGAGWEESDGEFLRRRTTPKGSTGGAGSNNQRGRCARSRSRAQRRDVRRTGGETREPFIYTSVQMLEKFSQCLKKSHEVECVSERGQSPYVFLESSDRDWKSWLPAIKRARETADAKSYVKSHCVVHQIEEKIS